MRCRALTLYRGRFARAALALDDMGGSRRICSSAADILSDTVDLAVFGSLMAKATCGSKQVDGGRFCEESGKLMMGERESGSRLGALMWTLYPAEGLFCPHQVRLCCPAKGEDSG